MIKESSVNELVYGKNPVLEVIENSSLQVNKIWMSENFNDRHLKSRVISFAKENKIPFHIVPAKKLNNLTNVNNHQGIVLKISPIQYKSPQEIIEVVLKTNFTKIVLIAHEIEDNYNLGAMIRTFVSAGGKGIILTGRSNVGINATTIKTSSGTIFQAGIARTANCVSVLNKLKESRFWIVGTDNSLNAENLYKLDFPDLLGIVVGNEHNGLGDLVKKNCDFLVRVPITAIVDSLNVSVAFGIILFEILRQKNLKT